jgi:hypothetical protein
MRHDVESYSLTETAVGLSTFILLCPTRSTVSRPISSPSVYGSRQDPFRRAKLLCFQEIKAPSRIVIVIVMIVLIDQRSEL